MNEKVLNVDTLSKLMEIIPSEDEQREAERKIMQEGTRNVKDYGQAEQFYFGLCDFYNLEERLKLWMFKQNFREICDSLQAQYKTIGMACDKLKSNKNLKQLLTIVLAFGNHMNSGTRKGQIYGFDLKILTGMTGVKSFDNTRSLLMYIYEFCDRKYPNAIKVLPELTNTVKSAASMETETLKNASQRITDNMKLIKDLVTSDEFEFYDEDDRFINSMEKFYKSSQKKMKRFNVTVQNVNVSTKRVMRKYCFGTEDSPQTIEVFFQTWHKFFEDFRNAKEKLIQLEKERQKRIAKRKKAKEKEKKKRLHQKYGKQSSGAVVESKEEEDPVLPKGSSLFQEFEKRQKFEAAKGTLHGKLSGHVKKKSIFVQNGGKLDGQTNNETMRRLSSMYQTDLGQISALEAARRKAATLKYNKFTLPDPKANPTKWTNKKFKDKFAIPDEKPMMKPMSQRQRMAGPSKQVPTGPKPGGPKPAVKTRSTPSKQLPTKQKNQLPGPPSGPPPNNALPVNGRVGNGSMGFQPVMNYGNNPQAQWQNQNQQALGYGSNPNLSYNQAFAQQGNVNQGMYQQAQQQGQFRPNQMQPVPNKYNYPFKPPTNPPPPQ